MSCRDRPVDDQSAAGVTPRHGDGARHGTRNFSDPQGRSQGTAAARSGNLEAFGFEEDFEGYIEFDVQGGDGPTGVDAGPFAVGPADAEGFFVTDYFNVAGGEVIENGHYKVTVYGKFGGAVDYEDVKAKSKVFKVDCPTPQPTPATPTAPTSSDVCEPATGQTDDRITIRDDAGFTYTVDGTAVAAGQVVATGTSYTVVAVPKPGVVAQEGATTQWTFTFTKVACTTSTPPVVVPPPDVAPAEASGRLAGGLRGSCQGTLRTMMRNGFEDSVRFTLRIGDGRKHYVVKGDTTRRVRTTAPARARVVLRARGKVVDRLRMPARCAPPDVLPETGLRATTSA